MKEPDTVVDWENIGLDLFQAVLMETEDMAGCAVRRSPIDGYGLFLKRAIKKGERIIEYVGEVCTALEARIREGVYRQQRNAPEYLKRISENSL